MSTQWVCHARPVRLKGKPCGHLNTGKARKTYVAGGVGYIEVCDGCGCTRKASDDRLAEEQRT